MTALYTSAVWSWARFAGAELLRSREADQVFAVTNAVLAVAAWFVPGAPSLRHSLAQRHAIIDHLVRASGATTVVELAAGLSRRGAHLSADPSLAYVEVDLPAVIARKERLLARTAAGREVLARPNLRRVPADVTEVDLRTLVGPGTTVIAEGLLMYLDAEAQRALWGRIAEALPAGRWVFDLVPAVEQPKAGAVGRALGWCMSWFTRGQRFTVDTRSREDIRAELLAAGFSAVRWVEPTDLPAEVPFLEARTQTLVFVCEKPATRLTTGRCSGER